jgi:hypothetical protein
METVGRLIITAKDKSVQILVKKIRRKASEHFRT